MTSCKVSLECMWSVYTTDAEWKTQICQGQWSHLLHVWELCNNTCKRRRERRGREGGKEDTCTRNLYHNYKNWGPNLICIFFSFVRIWISPTIWVVDRDHAVLFFKWILTDQLLKALKIQIICIQNPVACLLLVLNFLIKSWHKPLFITHRWSCW